MLDKGSMYNGNIFGLSTEELIYQPQCVRKNQSFIEFSCMLFLVFRKSEGSFLSAIINTNISIINTLLLMQKFRC